MIRDLWAQWLRVLRGEAPYMFTEMTPDGRFVYRMWYHMTPRRKNPLPSRGKTPAVAGGRDAPA